MSWWFDRAWRCGVARLLLMCGALSCAGISACQVADDAHLLDVTGISRDDVSIGDNLRISGEGFVTGAACRVVLRGELFVPGERVQPVRVELPALAVSANEVEARLPPDRFANIGSHATFTGSLTLRFSAAAGASHVSGTLNTVSFDITRISDDVSQRYAERRRAEDTLNSLGLVLEDEQEIDAGLRVRWARDGSAAALAQIKQGDVLTHLGGLRLRALSDFVPDPSASQISLRVRPSERPGEREVTLQLASPTAVMLGDSGWLVTALAVLVLLCVVVLAPTPRRVVRFRVSTDDATDTKDTKDTRDTNDTKRPSHVAASAAIASRKRMLTALVWPIVASSVWLVMAAGERWNLTLHVSALAASIGAIRLVMSASGQVGRARWLATLRELGALSLVFLPIACVGLVAGTLTLSGMVAQQAGEPWHWFVFKAPPLLLGALVFAGATRGVVERARDAGDAWAMGFAIVLAGCFAAAFLGGWQPVAASWLPRVDPFAIGLVLFAAKAGVLTLLFVSRVAGMPRLSTYRWVGLAVVSVALSLVWIRVPIAPSVELMIGYSACTVCVTLGLLRALGMQRALSRP